MFTKQIGVLNNIDWEFMNYSDAMLIKQINQLAKSIDKFEVLELYLDDDENGNVCIILSLQNAGMQTLGSSRSLYVHKVNLCDGKEDWVAFKQEAYRIKRFLKKKYPGIFVTSTFCWKYTC